MIKFLINIRLYKKKLQSVKNRYNKTFHTMDIINTFHTIDIINTNLGEDTPLDFVIAMLLVCVLSFAVFVCRHRENNVDVPPPPPPNEVVGECPICIEECSHSESCVTACNHVFHAGCLAKWSKNSNSCPMCRAPLIVSLPEVCHSKM